MDDYGNIRHPLYLLLKQCLPEYGSNIVTDRASTIFLNSNESESLTLKACISLLIMFSFLTSLAEADECSR